VGLLIFSIPIVWIAWRIRRALGESPFFKQIRIGYRRGNFQIMKFRTMSREGRIPPFCRWLRATALDELPQLLHILNGQMSFVGPRPLIPEDLQELGRFPEGKRRFGVRPGLAGLAQLYGGKFPGLGQRLKWDLIYVKRCSLRLDLWILFQSLAVTLRGAWEKPGHKPASRLEPASRSKGT